MKIVPFIVFKKQLCHVYYLYRELASFIHEVNKMCSPFLYFILVEVLEAFVYLFANRFQLSANV